MSKTYGNRWKIVDAPRLGSGGQSEVFRVVDVTGAYKQECALKRVLNPARHDRFRREIEAITRLSHPNIIKLIDHSALDDASKNPQKQFLVMPIAEGGDLSRPDRLTLYKDSIDPVLTVAKQLACALRTAHDVGIIHRDVKPQNVLFTGLGHEIWLADFGICLVRDQPRVTEGWEVVGPRSFLAPELEDGGHLDVTAAADVYSLGKVIYYMLSGGVVIPRENLERAKHGDWFKHGERRRLMKILLGKMICSLEQRIKTMEEVIGEFKRIEEWEHKAQISPLDRSSWDALGKLRENTARYQHAARANEAARLSEAQKIDTVRQSFSGWIRAKLESAATVMTEPGLIAATVHKVTNQKAPYKASFSLLGDNEIAFDLSINRRGQDSPYSENLRCALFRSRTNIAGQPVGISVSERDTPMVFFPYYVWLHEPDGRRLCLEGYVQRKKANIPRAKRTYVTPDFEKRLILFEEFAVSEWPSVTAKLDVILAEAIEMFIKFLDSGANMFLPGKE